MLKEELLKYKVSNAVNVEGFLQRYYKPERCTGRGKEYAQGLLKSYEEEFQVKGFCFISRHDSVTGCIVAFFKGSDQ